MNSEMAASSPVNTPRVCSLQILHCFSAISLRSYPPSECVHCMVGLVMSSANTEHSRLVTHKSMIGIECEGNRTLLEDCCFGDPNLLWVPMDISEPIVVCDAHRRIGVIHQG